MIKDCPHCGSKDALEMSLKIDLDDVVLEKRDDTPGWAKGTVVGFVPARSANNPDTGLVYEEAEVSCRDCGAKVDADVPSTIIRHWLYAPDNA